MRIVAIQTPRFKPHQSLLRFIQEQIPLLMEGDILVVTSKIVALAEGRVATSNPETKRNIILQESDETVETKWCLLTRRGADWSANAGIDESNADGKLILLPENAKETAIQLRKQLIQMHHLSSLGIIITDSRIRPLHQGTLGIALAWAGIAPLKDYVGTPDLDGRLLKMTKANIIHALAGAAVVEMGEGAESKPLAVISDATVSFTETNGACADLAILPHDDLYASLFHEKM